MKGKTGRGEGEEEGGSLKEVKEHRKEKGERGVGKGGRRK